MSDKDSALKPCPFCGGEAKLVNRGGGRFCIECQGCPCVVGEPWGARESPNDLTSTWDRRDTHPITPKEEWISVKLRDLEILHYQLEKGIPSNGFIEKYLPSPPTKDQTEKELT